MLALGAGASLARSWGGSMRLKKGGKIAGVPVMKVRDALRRCGGPDHLFTTEAIAEKCGVSADVAAQVVSALEREGHIKPAKHGDGPGWWETTLKGNALRLASTRTLKRATAARMLGELLERAKFVNSNESEFAYKVKRIRVFGSYLTHRPVVG